MPLNIARNSAAPDARALADTCARAWAAQGRGRDRLVLLDTEFGEGHHFLATWAAWRAEPQRCGLLQVIAFSARAPLKQDLARCHAGGPLAALATELADAWPAVTPNPHRLAFEAGAVQLLWWPGPALSQLKAVVAQVDGFWLADNTLPQTATRAHSDHLGKALARLAAPDAWLFSPAVAPGWAQGLVTAGFERGDEHGGAWRYRPRFQPRRAPSTHSARAGAAGPKHVLVLGAGLAGCSATAALAKQGWQVTLIDRQPAPTMEASGNPGGLFHSVVHARDGHHARFSRACALETTRLLRQWPVDVPWAPATGLLRLETTLPGAAAMQAMLDALHLPADHVAALSPAQASQLAGVPVDRPAWHYPGGGWLPPANLARHWLDIAGSACRFIGGAAVQAIRHDDGGWQVLDAAGACLARAPCLVLASAGDAGRLLKSANPAAARLDWPVVSTRGQLSVVPGANRTGFVLPRLPIAGAGYLLPEVGGAAVFGATSQANDSDPSVRVSDHQINLARLAELGAAWAETARQVDVDTLQGRTQWRSTSRDRLPLIGAVPQAWLDGESTGCDQPRFVPRAPGLFVYTALGSRGITWAGLGAEVLAAWVSGSVMPLEADLVDAVDPARFLTRAHRQAVADRERAKKRN